LVDALRQQASLRQERIHLAGICLSGVGRERDREIVTAALSAINLANKIVAGSDAMGALTGAFASDPGIIVNAGTGAFAFGKTGSGKIIRVGGWGYLIGDEGSGYALGRNAVNAALQDWDGRGEPTTLRRRFEQHFKVASIDLILDKIYDSSFDRGQMADLSPLVFDAASEGDRVAKRLVQQTGKELGRLALAAVRKFTGSGMIKLALLGNLFRRPDLLLPAFWEMVQPERHRVELVEPRFHPAIGAALLAMLQTGTKVPESFLRNLAESAREPGTSVPATA